MGLEQQWMMTCDDCGEFLTDRDGPSWGNKDYLMEHAKACGWIGTEEGWFCGTCQRKPSPSKPQEKA